MRERTNELDNSTYLAEMESKFEIVRTDDCSLLLDLDDEEAYQVCQDHLVILQREMPQMNFRIAGLWLSKSGVGRHAVVKADAPMSIVERLALQACLGSDRKRELLALIRYEEGIPEKDISVLFKPKTDKNYEAVDGRLQETT